MEMDEILQILKKFGLSFYEASVYATLIKLGPSKAGEICRHASVPQSKIYEVLDNLINKHFVEFVNGRPKQFKAIPPSITLKSKIEEEKKKLDELQSMINVVEQVRREENVIEGIWASKSEGLKDFVARLCYMYDKSKKYVYLITRDFTWTPSLVDSVKRCLKRGVKIRAITMTEINEDNYHRAMFFSRCGVEIRLYKVGNHPRIIVVDGTDVLLRLDENPNKPRNFRFTSLYSTEPTLVAIFDNYLKNLYKNSKPIDFNLLSRVFK